jgi:hypothetical protein
MQAVPNTPDSFIHKGYLQQQGTDTAALMQNLLQTAPWNKRDNPAMMMRGHKLKRTKFFAFAHDDPNVFQKYGYRGFQWSSLKLYKRWSTVPVLRKALQDMRINAKPAVFSLSPGDARGFVLTSEAGIEQQRDCTGGWRSLCAWASYQRKAKASCFANER